MPQRFNNIAEYAQADLGQRYQATEQQAAGVDAAQVDALWQQVQAQGYVIIPDLLNQAQLNSLGQELHGLLNHTGRNNFEGLRTQRMYSVIEKTLSCNPLLEHPLILGLLGRVLQPNYLLSQLQVINILPGEEPQLIHTDDSLYPIPRPRPALSAATIWAIDDFTQANGATRLIPGSHLWGERHPDSFTQAELDSTVYAEMPAGSVIFFLGNVWHGGGANITESGRLAVTCQYCEPWLRSQENYSLSISRDRARQCSPAVQRMLGYSLHRPFVGFVNGQHPRRLLE